MLTPLIRLGRMSTSMLIFQDRIIESILISESVSALELLLNRIFIAKLSYTILVFLYTPSMLPTLWDTVLKHNFQLQKQQTEFCCLLFAILTLYIQSLSPL